MAASEREKAQAASFGAAAASYERGRPTYPPEAIDWLLPAGARRVLDLGAGTGKLTRLLHGRGLDVVAVEPSSGMRGQLTQAVPGVPVCAGTAEEIPLDDGSVDAVLVAQAWHWVDPQRATGEVARVLAPGGRLGLLWNVRDEREDWVAQFGQLLHGDRNQDTPAAASSVGPPFGPVEHLDVEWRCQMTPDAVIDLASSRSYIITMPPGDRAAVLAGVRQLLGTHPALAGAAQVVLPYITRCYRATLTRSVSAA
jgi:SAM-dependent methyltransferase